MPLDQYQSLVNSLVQKHMKILRLKLIIFGFNLSRKIFICFLISAKTYENFTTQIKSEYDQLAIQHAARQSEKKILSFNESLNNKPILNWDNYSPPKPK